MAIEAAAATLMPPSSTRYGSRPGRLCGIEDSYGDSRRYYTAFAVCRPARRVL
jgi:hypothetical protein